MSSYLFARAYPAATRVLSTSRCFSDAVNQMLRDCREHFGHRIWQRIAALDFEKERAAIEDFVAATFADDPPLSDIEMLWLALMDQATGFQLRGNNKWSRDPARWHWTFADTYFGEVYESALLGEAYALVDALPRTRQRHRATCESGEAISALEVVDLYLSTALFGAALLDVVRKLPSAVVLSGRKDRWFAVSHPDSLYGVILGRRVGAQWVSFDDASMRVENDRPTDVVSPRVGRTRRLAVARPRR